MLKTEELQLVSEWDKTFLQSEKVDHQKVTFSRKRTIWRSQRTVFRIICADDG